MITNVVALYKVEVSRFKAALQYNKREHKKQIPYNDPNGPGRNIHCPATRLTARKEISLDNQ